MRQRNCRTFFLTALLGSGLAVTVAPVRAAGEVAAAAAVTPPSSPLKVGVDTYFGASNLDGQRRFSDGMWAGSGPAFPSVAYLRWDNGKGSAAKLSLGTGKMYTGAASLVDQPVEAWYQVPAGSSASVTVGKFWVPFAQQEWQYETKPGAMVQWSQGATSVAASANYNENTRAANAYARLGRSWGDAVSVGVSLGAGKGLSFDSVHDRAWALDATVSRAGWRVNAEYQRMDAPGGQPFRFGYAKLSNDNLGAWKPFVARYDWDDASETFGRFHSTVLGLGFQVNKNLSLEGAAAATGDKNVSWLQMHWTWER